MLYLILLIFLLFYGLCAQEAPINYSIYNHVPSYIVYIFAHGFGATQCQGNRLFSKTYIKDGAKKENPWWLIDGPLILFDFPDAKNDSGGFLRKEVNLGQETDIQRLKETYIRVRTDFPTDTGIVLTGISRGSTTIINFYKDLSPEERSNIKALVLESPFETLSSVIKHLLKRFRMSWMPFSVDFANSVCQVSFPKISMDGPFAIQSIEHLPPDLPIIMIHSKKDRVVPIKSSRILYYKLRRNGNQNVYLVELASGDHGKLLQGADAQFYACVVHAFYKKYNLPHNPDFAEKGSSLLELCQPTLDEVQRRLQRKRSNDALDDDIDESTDEELIAELQKAVNE